MDEVRRGHVRRIVYLFRDEADTKGPERMNRSGPDFYSQFPASYIDPFGRGRLAGGMMPFMRRYSTIWP
jgi:hypothetical protein